MGGVALPAPESIYLYLLFSVLTSFPSVGLEFFLCVVLDKSVSKSLTQDDIPGDGEIEQELEPKKRDRSRLTPAQREMMRVYAGRLGWSRQGHNEEELLRFCSDIGIIPQVFKVWMNNHRRKYANAGETSAATGGEA